MSDPSATPEPPPSRRFKRRARLRHRTSFHNVTTRGDVFPGREVVVRRFANEVGYPRMGCATPRAYGTAVKRNRFRRLVREAFRHRQDRLGAYDFLVSPKRSLVKPTLEGIAHDLERTLTKQPARPRHRPRRKGK